MDLLKAMEIVFIYFKGLVIRSALGKEKRLLFVKHCLPIVDEIPPSCEIQQMDYQGDAYGLLQTRHCFCWKVQRFDDVQNKAHAVSMFY